MPPHPYGWLSLLPPAVAIVMAIVTRRIVLSLILGIFAGALVMARGDVLVATHHTWETHLWSTMIDPGKLRVFSFTLLMGAMIGVITRSGGMQGLIDLITPYAKSGRTGQLATWFLGMLIFFDDYANTILLGNTMRPICDRLKVSREKLAYLVDSTAAPVAGLVPLSTWVAVEVDYIAGGLESIGADGRSAFGLFLASIPYRFYVGTALCLVPLTVLMRRDFGPMLKAQRRVSEEVVDGPDSQILQAEETPPRASWIHAVLPIAVTLALVVYFIHATGSRTVCNDAVSSAEAAARSLTSDAGINDTLNQLSVMVDAANVRTVNQAIADLAVAVSSATGLPIDELPIQLSSQIRLRDVIGAADSSLALQYGSLAGLLTAWAAALICRLLTLEQMVSSAFQGAKIVLPAVAILWTAAALSRMTTNTSVDGLATATPFQFQDHRMYTAEFLAEKVTGTTPDGQPSSDLFRISPRSLPTLVFVLAAVVAFATGTSWGTMGILVPMVIQTASALLAPATGTMPLDDPILLSSIGGVLAGAIFGDHCSPISDTTVLSSQSCGCNHLSHVWTQMPYALLAAMVSILFGTLPIGFGVSVWLLLPVQLIALVAMVRILGKQSSP